MLRKSNLNLLTIAPETDSGEHKYWVILQDIKYIGYGEILCIVIVQVKGY
jgi:hypothetical protein